MMRWCPQSLRAGELRHIAAREQRCHAEFRHRDERVRQLCGVARDTSAAMTGQAHVERYAERAILRVQLTQPFSCHLQQRAMPIRIFHAPRQRSGRARSAFGLTQDTFAETQIMVDLGVGLLRALARGA